MVVSGADRASSMRLSKAHKIMTGANILLREFLATSDSYTANVTVLPPVSTLAARMV